MTAFSKVVIVDSHLLQLNSVVFIQHQFHSSYHLLSGSFVQKYKFLRMTREVGLYFVVFLCGAHCLVSGSMVYFALSNIFLTIPTCGILCGNRVCEY